MKTCTAILTLLAAASASALELQKCDSTATSEIKAVHSKMNSRLSATVARFTWLKQKQRDELKKKWPKLKIDCEDDKNKCAKDDIKDGFIITGYAHGSFGNTVNVCYYNAVESAAKLCDLVETIWHEKGHADGMPKMNHHNHPDKHPEVFKKDAVYRMGFAAGDECRANMFAGTANRALKGNTNLGLGVKCSKDSQCKSEKCKDAKCVCRKDADCGSKKCKEPLGGTPYCK